MSQMTVKPQGGRPSKGPRSKIGPMFPQHVYDRIQQYSELTGRPKTEIVIDLVTRHLDEIDPSALDVSGVQPRLEIDEARKTA